MKTRLAKPDTFEMESAESACSLVPATTLSLVPVKRPKAVSLKSLGAVRRELQKVYTDVRQGRLPSQEGSRLTYILSVVGKVLEIEEVEKRLLALEQRS